MIKLFSTAVVITLLNTGVVFADMTCRTDALGNTRCTTDDGNSWKGRTDALGNTRWTDDYGNSVKCRTDALGTTRCRD